MPWSAAKTHCTSLGSLLATIHSREENDFVRTLIPNHAWLGRNDIVSDGTWVWEDGVEWGGFTSWLSGEPNGGDYEQCLLMRYDSTGNWNDQSCSDEMHYVCKKCGLKSRQVMIPSNLFMMVLSMMVLSIMMKKKLLL